MYTLEGVSSVANFITAYEESQENRDSHFLICSVFFVSKGNFFTFILLHCSWYWCRVAVVERLPVLYHSADYILFTLGPLGPLWNL